MIQWDHLSHEMKVQLFPYLATPYEDHERQLKTIENCEQRFNKVAKLVEDMSDIVNGDDRTASVIFNMVMSQGVHRTLQQSSTRLMLKWIEHVATDEYGTRNTDGRNIGSHRICRKIVDAVKAESKMDFGPAAYLQTI